MLPIADTCNWYKVTGGKDFLSEFNGEERHFKQSHTYMLRLVFVMLLAPALTGNPAESPVPVVLRVSEGVRPNSHGLQGRYYGGQDFQVATLTNINLAAGIQRMRVCMGTAGFTVDWVEVERKGVTGP